MPGNDGFGRHAGADHPSRVSCLSAPEMVEKVGHRQDMNTGGGFRPIHERSEVPRIAGEQMGCPACGRGLEMGWKGAGKGLAKGLAKLGLPSWGGYLGRLS